MTDRKRLKTRLSHWSEILIFKGLSIMPMAVASGAGAILGRISGRYFRKSASALTLKNLAKFRPDLSDADLKRNVAGMWDHLGRILAEFARYKTLRYGGLIEVVGADALPPPGSPVVVAGCHVGNWETISHAVMMAGHTVAGTYQPLSNSVRHNIMMRQRHGIGWISLAPDAAPMRRAIRHLDEGGAVVIYIDEYVAGVVNAPALGRNIKLDRNIYLTARLAHRSQAPLVFAKCQRLKGAKYRVTFERADMSRDVDASVNDLDRLLEAAVRERPEQWLMLHVLKF